MAVEIKELVIKATVAAQAQTGNGTPAQAGIDGQEIANQCVAEVLKILQREKER
jgi:hypothetical protein